MTERNRIAGPPQAGQTRVAGARGSTRLQTPAKPSTSASAIELAALLGVTDRTIRTLTEEGYVVKLAHGTYDLAASIQGFIRYKVEQAEAGGRRAGTSTLAAEREREIRERADNMALRNAQLRSELVPVTDVEARWSDILRGVRSRMLAVPGRCQQRLGHLTAHDVDTIDREVRDALTEAGHDGA